MSRNEVTGDIISTGQAKGDKEKYANGWELLWGNRTPIRIDPEEDPCPSCPQGAVCKTPKCGRLIKEAQDKSSY